MIAARLSAASPRATKPEETPADSVTPTKFIPPPMFFAASALTSPAMSVEDPPDADFSHPPSRIMPRIAPNSVPRTPIAKLGRRLRAPRTISLKFAPMSNSGVEQRTRTPCAERSSVRSNSIVFDTIAPRSIVLTGADSNLPTRVPLARAVPPTEQPANRA